MDTQITHQSRDIPDTYNIPSGEHSYELSLGGKTPPDRRLSNVVHESPKQKTQQKDMLIVQKPNYLRGSTNKLIGTSSK